MTTTDPQPEHPTAHQHSGSRGHTWTPPLLRRRPGSRNREHDRLWRGGPDQPGKPEEHTVTQLAELVLELVEGPSMPKPHRRQIR
jgi:hypothetical protein